MGIEKIIFRKITEIFYRKDKLNSDSVTKNFAKRGISPNQINYLLLTDDQTQRTLEAMIVLSQKSETPNFQEGEVLLNKLSRIQHAAVWVGYLRHLEQTHATSHSNSGRK